MQTLYAIWWGVILIRIIPHVRPLQRIVAFIVGISEYPDSPLDNAVKDAEFLIKILRKKGVIVIFVTNCSAEEFKEKQKEFLKLLTKDDLAFFFFAGHACVFDNSPRLLTIPKQGRKLDVKRDSVNVYLLLSRWAKSR